MSESFRRGPWDETEVLKNQLFPGTLLALAFLGAAYGAFPDKFHEVFDDLRVRVTQVLGNDLEADQQPRARSNSESGT